MLTYEKICDMFLTYRIKLKKITEEINEYLLPYDISMQHAVYIMALSCYGDMTIKELNANVDNDGAITTRVVKKLKKEGYVKKLGKTIKKYKITLTDKGHMLSKEILSAFNKAKKVHLGKLTQEDFITLSTLAEKLQ